LSNGENLELSPSKKTDIARAYDEIKSIYDRTRFGDKADYTRRRVDEVVRETLPIFLKGGSVLEVGTGTARYGIFLSEKSYSFVGIDISSGAISVAKRKAKSKRLDFALLKADGENLPFKSCAFCNVLCILTFGFLENVSNALRESFRVLERDGRIIIVYHNYRVKSRFLRRSLPRKYVFITRYTFEETKELLEKIGFQIVYKKDINNFPSPIYYIVPELIHSKILKHLDNMLSGGDFTLIVGEKYSESLEENK